MGPITLLRVGVCAFVFLISGTVAGLGLFSTGTASAAAGINQEMNFEGKIVTSAGLNIPDGTYNMEFKVYSGCTNEPTNNTGCTLAWTEDYLVNQSDGVSFTSGTYAVNLGQYCPLSGGSCTPSAANDGNTSSGVNWNSYPLYLSLQIGNTSSCSPSSNNFQAACGGDGEMNPYVLLTSTPYAFNSNEVGGFTASQLGQLAASQTWTGTNAFQYTSPTAFEVQSAGGASTVLGVDTTDGWVGIGTASPTSRLTIPWITGDSTATVSVGSSNASDNQFALQATSYSSAAVYATSTSSTGVSGHSTSGTGVYGVSSSGNGVNGASATGVSGYFQSTSSSDTKSTLETQLISGSTADLFQAVNSGSTIYFKIASNGLVTASAGMTVSGGAISLTGNAASSLTTSSGALSLTSATSATWGVATAASGNGGDLTVQAGSGASGTNNGGNLILQGGAATGSGTGGGVVVQSQTNSTTAFQVQNTSGSAVLTADTTNGLVTVGSSNSVNGALVLKNSSNSNALTLQSGVTTTSYSLTMPAAGVTGSQCLQSTSGSTSTATTLQFASCGGSSGVSALGAVDGSGTANANGATISGTTLYLNSADGTHPGVLNATTQNIGGAKTFSALITGSAGITTSGGAVTLQGNAASNLTTTSGALTVTSAAAATWSTSAGNLTVEANGTSALVLDTTGAGTADLGNTNATTVNVGNTTAATQTLIQGGTGTLAIGIQAGSGGTISMGTTSSNIITIGNTGSNNAVTLQANGISQVITGNGTTPSDVIKTSTNSATAFQIQNNNGTSGVLLTADTTNMRISIGSIGTATAQLYVSGTVPTTALYTSASLAGAPWDIKVVGNYAYVMANTTSKLFIYDVSNPASPVSDGSVAMAAAGNYLSVAGKYAYVTETSGSKLEVFDISNPRSPVSVGSVTTGSTPNGVYVQGKYAYVANSTGTHGSMQVIDVSNPTAPTVVGTVSLTSGVGPQGLFVQGNFAYIASKSTAAFTVVNIANPTAPAVTGTPLTGTALPTGLGASAMPYDVYVQGRYAYLTNNGTSGAGSMEVIDVSNPSSLQTVSNVATGDSATGVYVQGRYAYVTTYNGDTLQTIDVSNPASAASVGSYSLGSVNPSNLVVQGRYAYVADTGTDKFQVFDLGGEYAQQLQAGGIETGTLTVDGNASTAGDQNVGGGLSVGGNTELNGNVGVAGTFNVSSNNATVNSLPVTLQQSGSGNTGIQYTVGTNSFYQGQDSTGTFNISSSNSVATGRGSTFGNNCNPAACNNTPTAGFTSTILGNQFTATDTGSLNSIMMYFPAGSSGQVSMAVFTDNGSNHPNTYLQHTNTVTITPGTWNMFTLSSAVSVTSGTKYWFVWEMSATTATFGNENPTAGAQGAEDASPTSYAFASWGTNWGSLGGTQTYSTGTNEVLAYGIVNGTSSSDSLGNSLFSLTNTGQATYQDSSDSTSAFQVQNASGSGLFTVDTSDGEVIIGTGSVGESTPKLFVLDSSTSSSDPSTEVNGAMYYNSSMKSFQCGQSGTWVACDGLVYSEHSVLSGDALATFTTHADFADTYTIPANDCQPGVTYLITASGVYGTNANTVTYTFYLDLNNTSGTLVQSGALTTRQSGGVSLGGGWTVNATFVCDTTGASGTDEAQGLSTIMEASNTSNAPQGNAASVGNMAGNSTNTINTTTSNVIKIGASCNSSNATNEVQMRQFVVQRLGP